MKRAIITLVIIELCLIIALSGQKVVENLQETAAESQTLQSELIDIINNGVTAVTPTPEPVAVSETAQEIKETAAPEPEIYTISMPKDALANNIDFILVQANTLNVNVSIEDENVVYQITADEQNALINNTKAYIDSTVSKNISEELQEILYSEDYSTLTFILKGTSYDELPEIEMIEGYFVLLKLLENNSIDDIELNVTIQDSQTSEKFEEYSYVDKYNSLTE